MISEASEDPYNAYVSTQGRFLEGMYAQAPALSGHPAYQDCATVEVDGEVVATISNS